MRVLLTTYGSRGDVEPLVALAGQAQALGARVQVCAPPDEEFADLLRGAGVPLVPFAKPWRSWTRPATPAERTTRVAEFIAAQYDTVAAAAEGCDAILATAMSIFVARSVAEKAGIAHRFVAFSPTVLNDPHAQQRDALFGPSINAHRTSIGLPPVDDIHQFLFTHQPLLAADPALAPWDGTSDPRVIQTGAWLLPDQRPLPRDLLAFLAAGEAPVYVGFGSMRVSQDNAWAAVEAIRAHGRRAIIAHGWADLTPIDEQDDCFIVGEVNQQALFRRVAAVVHHGGAGTTTTAARAGATQVVVPQAGDQPYWGDRVVELGIGAAHDGPTPTAHTQTAALNTALAPQTRARATALAASIRTDGASTAAALLLDESNR